MNCIKAGLRQAAEQEKWIRQNFDRLNSCPGPHKFVPVRGQTSPQGEQTFVCSVCRCVAWSRDVFWYGCGLKHNTEGRELMGIKEDAVDLDLHTFYGTGTAAVANAQTAKPGTYIVLGAIGWFIHATQTGFLTLTVDPAGTPKLLGRVFVDSAAADRAGRLVLPSPVRVVVTGTQVIRAQLDAGAAGVVGHARLWAVTV